jgi:hypothetical protein
MKTMMFIVLTFAMLVLAPAEARANFLDSETGQWGRRDPLGYVNGVNLYEYAKSEVVKAQDPTGLDIVYASVRVSSPNLPPGDAYPGNSDWWSCVWNSRDYSECTSCCSFGNSMCMLECYVRFPGARPRPTPLGACCTPRPQLRPGAPQVWICLDGRTERQCTQTGGGRGQWQGEGTTCARVDCTVYQPDVPPPAPICGKPLDIAEFTVATGCPDKYYQRVDPGHPMRPMCVKCPEGCVAYYDNTKKAFWCRAP